MSNEAHDIFTDAYERITTSLPFDKEWSNGMSHFDKAIYGPNAPKLVYGEMKKSATPGGRRIIFVGTRLGTVAVYDRFTENDGTSRRSVFYIDTTAAIDEGGWFSQRYVNDYEMALAVGDGDDCNIGWRIEQIYSALKRST